MASATVAGPTLVDGCRHDPDLPFRHDLVPLYLLSDHIHFGPQVDSPKHSLRGTLHPILAPSSRSITVSVHAFVVMPDHVHLLLTPGEDVTLERTVQFVKGTFSFRLKRKLGYGREVWASGYHDERIRSAQHCHEVMEYIERNPVVRGLSKSPQGFPFGSSSLRWTMDGLPQWLKPPPIVVTFSAV
jgi:REP element-mobilizing transposase RayT